MGVAREPRWFYISNKHVYREVGIEIRNVYISHLPARWRESAAALFLSNCEYLFVDWFLYRIDSTS